MIRLRCEDCGTNYYSAAARSMVERDVRCSACGGRLEIAEAESTVAVGAEREVGDGVPGGGYHRDDS